MPRSTITRVTLIATEPAYVAHRDDRFLAVLIDGDALRDPAAARADAHQRARILRDAAVQADRYSVRAATILDEAAARQETIGNGEAS